MVGCIGRTRDTSMKFSNYDVTPIPSFIELVVNSARNIPYPLATETRDEIQRATRLDTTTTTFYCDGSLSSISDSSTAQSSDSTSYHQFSLISLDMDDMSLASNESFTRAIFFLDTATTSIFDEQKISSVVSPESHRPTRSSLGCELPHAIPAIRASHDKPTREMRRQPQIEITADVSMAVQSHSFRWECTYHAMQLETTHTLYSP
jgi:hypothetical protein